MTDSLIPPFRKRKRNEGLSEPQPYNLHKDLEFHEQKEVKVSAIRSKHGIEVAGHGIPHPITEWRQCEAMGEDLISQLVNMGYRKPTPVQMQAIPVALAGRDIVGLSDTGSGKTLAYLLPIIVWLRQFEAALAGQGPRALIIVPTRELADQVYAVLSSLLTPAMYSAQYPPSYTNSTSTFSNPTTIPFQKSPYTPAFDSQYQTTQSYPLSSNVFHATAPGEQIHHHTNTAFPDNSSWQQYPSARPYSILGTTGGIPIKSQIRPIQAKGVDVIVATPGRLLALIERGDVKLDRLSVLVVDEIDRLLTANMEKDLRGILQHAESAAPESHIRQTILWSATLPRNLERVVRSAVNDPVHLTVGDVRQGAAVRKIVQEVVYCKTYEKKKILLEKLRRTPYPPVLVFCNSISNVDTVADMLRKEQFHAAGLHSEKDQSYRFRVMKHLKEGQLDILVCTDLAARGIDVPELTHVFNWDLPDDIEMYKHRIGRTGRAGRDGIAISLLTLNCKIAKELLLLLEKNGEEIPKELRDPSGFGRDLIPIEF